MMDNYADVLQICAIVFAISICYLLIKYIYYLIKKNRLVDFSLNVKTNRINPLVRLVHNTSNVLRKISFIKVKKYNNYARLVPAFKDGYDVIASKVLSSLLMLILYVFVALLYKSKLSIIVSLICLILGYVLLDFYYIYSSRNKNHLVDRDMLGAIIIMNNDFKANRSVEQAINDVCKRMNSQVSKELKKVLDDTKMGLNYGEAFLRMYERTHIKTVLDISHALSLYTLCGSDLIEIFSKIEKDIIEEEKYKLQVKSIKIFNKMFKLVFNILPILMIVILFSMNKNYLEMLMNTKGIILISLIVILYIIYIVTINKIVRRYNYDNK